VRKRIREITEFDGLQVLKVPRRAKLPSWVRRAAL